MTSSWRAGNDEEVKAQLGGEKHFVSNCIYNCESARVLVTLFLGDHLVEIHKMYWQVSWYFIRETQNGECWKRPF